MLVLLTGPVRSGKSRVAISLALASGAPVTLAAGARTDDPEMTRRILRHRNERPENIHVIETYGRNDWLTDVPESDCLLVDCLGTVLAGMFGTLGNENADYMDAESEERASAVAGQLVEALIARRGYTVVVSNEVGWGLVPAYPLGRLFRDVLGRTNRQLTDAADAAWLVVNGRCVNLTSAPREVVWPG